MRTLGLDLGTQSIGWAVVELDSGGIRLVKKGVQVFEKGVHEEKGKEKSWSSIRREYRAARRLKRRRRWRKQETLRVLVQHRLCPGLTQEDILRWEKEKVYPLDPAFREWLKTRHAADGSVDVNPYYFRWMVASQQLDLNDEAQRFALGRAFYHLAQRRGYKSNRIAGSEKDGRVEGEIQRLRSARGGRTLGQYFYEDCFGQEPVRGEGHYTSRADYEEEFHVICARQMLPQDLRDALHQAIFFQRPLKSQKGSVGKCLLEPGKPRAPISHPIVEKFRALQLVNNILVAGPGHAEMRPLSAAQRDAAIAWLLRRKKAENFEKLARVLAGRRARIAYGGNAERRGDSEWLFNFRSDAGLPPCPLSATLASLFGANWEDALVRRYLKAGGKSREQVVNDIWHVLFSFDDQALLQKYAREQLGLDADGAKEFAIPLMRGYAPLSLLAIRKILPYLEKGLIYSHAVFMANVEKVTRGCVSDWSAEQPKIESAIGRILHAHRIDVCCQQAVNALLKEWRDAGINPTNEAGAHPAAESALRMRLENAISTELGERYWLALPDAERSGAVLRSMETASKLAITGQYAPVRTLFDRIQAYLQQSYNVPERQLSKLYHPSAIDTYKAATVRQGGTAHLGSPRLDSAKNPVFMRTMHRLRSIVNALLAEGSIGPDTRIRVEMARDLTTANERAAIYREQREREKARRDFREKIREAGYEPSEADVLKYQLWEEQRRTCLYTGASICLSEFLGDNPRYDIEHTIPRSRRLDNSQANLTLCDRAYNRDIKGARIPAELADHHVILDRVRLLWGEQEERLATLVEKRKKATRSAKDKESKDKALQDLHYLRSKLRYWRTKLRNFESREVPQEFRSSQLVDTRIICKYAVQYLKSLFPRVESVKAETVHGVRAIWGLESKYRGNHVHHCADAILVACLDRRLYSRLAEYYREWDRFERSQASRPGAPEPWPGFAHYMNEQLVNEVLVVHSTQDKLLKQTKKKLRIRGRIQYLGDGRAVYQQGATARGSLHEQTNYGVIQAPPARERGPRRELKCVVRKKLDKEFKDFDAIVDERVRGIVVANKERIGEETIWFDEARRIPIRTVRVFVRKKFESMMRVGAHRDASRHDYKRYRCVANDGNYLTALYRGEANGRQKADWKVLSNFAAVEAVRTGTWDLEIPPVDEKGLHLCHVLKTGIQVLFYRSSPDELMEMRHEDVLRRLYRVTVMEGRIVRLVFHQCAQRSTEIEKWASAMDWEVAPPLGMRLSANKLQLLVEGEDFGISPTGTITWVDRAHA